MFYSDTYTHRDDAAAWLFLLEISLLYFAIMGLLVEFPLNYDPNSSPSPFQYVLSLRCHIVIMSRIHREEATSRKDLDHQLVD